MLCPDSPNKAIFLVGSAIPPNKVLEFFLIKSYVVIGFAVPIASPLMVRFESCNGVGASRERESSHRQRSYYIRAC
jgi:hypothetical protein